MATTKFFSQLKMEIKVFIIFPLFFFLNVCPGDCRSSMSSMLSMPSSIVYQGPMFWVELIHHRDGLVIDAIPSELKCVLQGLGLQQPIIPTAPVCGVTLLTHLFGDKPPITVAQEQIGLVLQGNRNWTADCSPNNILHMNYSKCEG